MVKALFAFHGVVETCMMSSEKTRILKIRGQKKVNHLSWRVPLHTFLNPQKQSRTVVTPYGIITLR